MVRDQLCDLAWLWHGMIKVGGGVLTCKWVGSVGIRMGPASTYGKS